MRRLGAFSICGVNRLAQLAAPVRRQQTFEYSDRTRGPSISSTDSWSHIKVSPAAGPPVLDSRIVKVEMLRSDAANPRSNAARASDLVRLRRAVGPVKQEGFVVVIASRTASDKARRRWP